MTALDRPAGTLGGVVAWYSVIHTVERSEVRDPVGTEQVPQARIPARAAGDPLPASS